MSFIFVAILLFIIVCYKELFLTTFDPAYARAIGISSTLWHYLLMSAVSATTVASFESVGAILVVALLIAPAAAAYLITDNFKVMLVLASVIGVLSSITGYYLAVYLDGSIAGAIATMAGVFFGLVLIFSPTHGIVFKKLRSVAATDMVQPKV
jgi:manganese/zinc/iron transport system permease protein